MYDWKTSKYDVTDKTVVDVTKWFQMIMIFTLEYDLKGNLGKYYYINWTEIFFFSPLFDLN